MMYAMLATVGVVLAVLGYLSLTSQQYRRLVPRLTSGQLYTPPRHHLARLQQTGRFRGVGVTTNCRAAAHLRGREFPFDQAPALPVSGCDAPTCRCSYRGLPERRQGIERRSGIDRRSTPRADGNERRILATRRRPPEA